MSTPPQIAPQSKGFFGSLFDLSFTYLVTTRVIKALYIIIVVLIGLGLLGGLIAAIADGGAASIIAAVIVGPLLALLYVVWARVFLEIILAIFRLLETNREIAFLSRQQVALLQQGTPRAPFEPPAA